MKDPVFLSSGHTYDREAVLSHFKENGHKDPKTGQPVSSEFLVDNVNLKESLTEFLAANPSLNKNASE